MLSPYLKILRPFNCLFSSIIILAVLWIAGVEEKALYILLPIIVFLCCGGGNVINDYFDYDIDKINNPSRPIPSGAISRKNALLYSILLFILSFCLLIYYYRFFLYYHLLILLVNITLLILYAKILKKIGFVGNVVVSYLVGSVFIFGGLSGKNFNSIVILAICAFFLNLSREIIKDLQDVPGDQRLNVRSIPIVLGDTPTLVLATSFLIIAFILGYIPYFNATFSFYYLIPMTLGFLICASSFYNLFRVDNRIQYAEITQKKIKFSMAIVLFAFLLGKWFK
jgi:geranylgeranylglycerol-phosphate geranylgeranyltransferase